MGPVTVGRVKFPKSFRNVTASGFSAVVYTFFIRTKFIRTSSLKLSWKPKNILYAEMELKSQLLLIVLCKLKKWICVLKINA